MRQYYLNILPNCIYYFLQTNQIFLDFMSSLSFIDIFLFGILKCLSTNHESLTH